MNIKITEYARDDDGKEVIHDTYEISYLEFYRIVEQLDKAIQNGEISSYSYTPV